MRRFASIAIAAILSALTLASLPAAADIPSIVSFQGSLTSAGQPVNASLQMTFRIYDVASGGTALWTETQTVAVNGGIYNVQLGSVTPIALPFDVPYFLGLSVGADAEMTPRQPLSSVPYAIRGGCNPGDRVNCYTGDPATIGNAGCMPGIRTCNPSGLGWGSCAGQVIPNCGTACANLQADVNNCGGCGTVCSNNNIVATACTAGQCTGTCAAGFGDCNSNKQADGCETPLNTTANCGSCGNVCPSGGPNVSTATCTSGTCGLTCNLGFGDCNANPADGCETNITNTVNNCGGCGHVCTVPNGTPGCQTSACVIASCNAGFQDCNGQVADGCETNTAGDPNNCGACNNHCSTNNGTPACTSGTCHMAVCNAGFVDCNGSASDGCECAGNICCGSACAPAHINGLGQSFDDCSPLGVPGTQSTYSLTMATEAANAWPFSGTSVQATCGSPVASVYYKQTATTCAVWAYTTSIAGHVNLNTANNTCLCPTGTDPIWK